MVAPQQDELVLQVALHLPGPHLQRGELEVYAVGVLHLLADQFLGLFQLHEVHFGVVVAVVQDLVQ